MQQIKKRFVMFLSALLAVSLLVAGCGSSGDQQEGSDKQADPTAGQAKPLDTTSKKVVAEYKGGKVTEGELNLYLNIFRFLQPQMAMVIDTPEAKKEIVKQYIAEKLIVRKMKDDKKYTKEADKAMKQLEEQVKQMPAQDKKKQDVESLLKENGITKQQLHTFLENNSKVSAYFENQVKEADLKKEYEKSEDFYDITLYHVLISTKDPQTQKKKRSDEEAKKRAEEVKKKLEDGAKFSEVAKKYSDDTGSKEQGGKYELQGNPEQQWVPEFAKAAKTLPLNKISDPVKTQYGYHVMKVTKRGKQPFDKVKEQIKGQKIQEMYQDFIQDEVKISKLDIPGDKGKEKK